MNLNNIVEVKNKLLIHEANRWLGVSEMGGNNRGQLIEVFQKAVDGIASGEPWCMAFVQYCIQSVDSCFDSAFAADACALKSTLKRSEHCLTVWNKSPELRIDSPVPGSLCIWQMYKDGKPTSAGHVGIVVAIDPDGSLRTIEGNTSSEDAVQREGDGVFMKQRQYPDNPSGKMRIKGFMRVW